MSTSLIEQTYVLEGTLVDKEGPDAGLEVDAGEFVWRPAGSRHSAWAPKGGLMVAIFQVPNKFFGKDGRVTDPNGRDLAKDLGTRVRQVTARTTRAKFQLVTAAASRLFSVTLRR